MEKIKSSSGKMAKFAGVLGIFAIVCAVLCVIGAVMGFAMNGFINQYYSDPEHINAAAGSLNADMGIFNILPFDAIRDAGNYGIYFGLQLLCAAVICGVYVYLFITLKKVLSNIGETGAAFAESESGKFKVNFIIITVIFVLFKGLAVGAIVGLILFGLYNVSLAVSKK